MNYQFDYFTSWFIYICFFLINFILLTYYSIYNKKVYILLSFVFITLFTGLRFNVGRDYQSYIDMYTLFDTNDFIYRITNFDYTIIFEEIGFDLLFFIGKLFISDRYNQSIIIFSSFVNLFFLYLFLNDNNKIANFIFFFYFFLFYFQSLTIMRQFISVTIILFSFNYLQKKNFLKSILYFFFALSFHISSIMVLPLYFILYFFNNFRLRFFLIVFFSVVLFFSMNFISGIVEGTRYSSYFFRNPEFGLGNFIIRLPIVFYSYFILFFNKNSKRFNDLLSTLFLVIIYDLGVSQSAYYAPIINRGLILTSVFQIYLFSISFQSKSFKTNLSLKITAITITLAVFLRDTLTVDWIRDTFSYGFLI
jgi:hypothetical protein